MPNMIMNKTPMPEQEPSVRIHNFKEVALGYTEKMAREEAQRCLNCKNRPCVSGCPVNVQIPDFIKLIADGKFIDAYSKIIETNSLPAVCGRVCPQESQCESKCVRGIKGEPVAIGRLERFAADYAADKSEEKIEKPKSNGHKVAVIGAGPAGLTCAGDLVKLGYEVTVFEAFHTAGGVLMYGIPEFRLPKSIVEREISKLEAQGVKILTNMVLGKVFTIDELLGEMGFEAVFIGSGAGLPQFMNIEGENLIGVYSANEFLTRINLMKAYRDDYDTPIRISKKTAVIGGGNVAMDAARSAKRLGAEDVYIVYRRSMNELPARAEEVHHAKEEGIEFKLLCSPVRIIGNDNGEVTAIECIKMELGEPDASGRRRPVPIEGSNFTIDVDSVIIAIGTTPNPLLLRSTPGLEANSRGCLKVDENLMTTREGVFAGGDAVTGAATVILAMGAGKQAAHSIDEYIKRKAAERK
ncbi:MAG: NADPH-dependent glutamate synthase [[Clostridium] cellulosi]